MLPGMHEFRSACSLRLCSAALSLHPHTVYITVYVVVGISVGVDVPSLLLETSDLQHTEFPSVIKEDPQVLSIVDSGLPRRVGGMSCPAHH